MRTAIFLAVIALLFTSVSNAQKEACDLVIATFSYGQSGNTTSRQLTNLKLGIDGNGIEQNLIVAGKSPDRIFRGIASGIYKLQVIKDGFKSRSKEIRLMCEIAERGTVYHQIHVWPEKEYRLIDSDFFEPALPKTGETAKDASAQEVTVDKIDTGSVVLKLVIDEDGNVASASKVSGKDELAERAIKNALRSKFAPTLKSGTPRRVEGNMTYNFVR